MPSFLRDISRFYGTGECNQAGENLEEFLEKYDPDKYRTPSCTTDALIFSCGDVLTDDLTGLKVLLVKRSNHPSIGYWALPGGFAELNEDLDATARRELLEETGVEGLLMEQIATYGDHDRDPRTRVITTAYMALLRGEECKVQAGDDAADALWCDVGLKCLSKTFNMEESESREEYRLTIRNAEKGLETSAVVEYRRKGDLIREEKFTVKEQGMIAVDHAAIIVHGLYILRKRLRE